jgi:hypothetical protein
VHPRFQKAYDKLERQRGQIIDIIKNLSEDDYENSPSGKWSIAQILTHLLTSERLSILYMKKKALGINDLPNSGIKESLFSMLLKISQRIPFRYKAPRAIVENTPEVLPLPELIKEWDKARSNLRAFLETIDPIHVRRIIFKHPIGGRLDAVQSIEFMHEHINHHMPQIRRLLKGK